VSDSATDSGPPGEKSGCVVGTSLGLLLIVTFVFLIADPGGQMGTGGQLLDPSSELGEEFAFAELPFELEFDQAAKLPGGDRVVRLFHPDHGLPDPSLESELAKLESESTEETSEDSEDSEGEGEEAKKAEAPMSFKAWTPPEIDFVEGTPPTEVLFVFPKAPDGAVRTFAGPKQEGGDGGRGRGRGGRMSGSMGGTMMAGPGQPIPIGGGDLDWGPWRVGYRHERKFGKETATDEFRVNLSQSGRYCVLIIRWPVDHAGSVERVEELLEGFARTEV